MALVMSNAVNVEGRVEYVEADFADAYAALPQSRRARVLFPLILVLLLGPVIAGERLESSLVRLALVVFVWWYAFTRGRREFIRRALADFGPTGPRTATFRFDEFGVSFETALRTGRTAWSVIWSHRETERAFLVFLNAATPLVVPKRAFSEADQKSIAAELTSRVTATNSRRERKLTIALVLLAILVVVALFVFLSFFDR